MAFSKRKNKFIKYVLISLSIVIVASAAVIGGYYLYNSNISKIKVSYMEQVDDLKFEIYNNKRHVFIPKGDIMCGTFLTKELFNEVDLVSSLPIEVFITEEDFGKFARYDIKQDVPVMKYMLIDEKISDDLREEEFNMFLLLSNLTKGKYIDVRIMFANGEDYIILSKKKVREINLDQNTIWCWLDEKEILTVSSAIVDAYIRKGTKIYTVTYVEPASQKEAISTYPVNLDVLRIIENDPNILNRAKDYLAEQSRIMLEQRLGVITQETLTDIQKGVEQEVSERLEKIKRDTDNEAQIKNNTPVNTDENVSGSKAEQNSPTDTQKEGGDNNEFF